jgi:hypothetical protein
MLPPVVCAPGGPAAQECRAGPARSHRERVPSFAPPVPYLGGAGSPSPSPWRSCRWAATRAASRRDRTPSLARMAETWVVHGLVGDVQAGGDVGVAQVGAEQRQHLELAGPSARPGAQPDRRAGASRGNSRVGSANARPPRAGPPAGVATPRPDQPQHHQRDDARADRGRGGRHNVAIPPRVTGLCNGSAGAKAR